MDNLVSPSEAAEATQLGAEILNKYWLMTRFREKKKNAMG